MHTRTKPLKRRAILGSTGALLALSLLVANKSSTVREHRFSYTVPFVCGFDPDPAFQRIVPGQYATSILIHNPGPGTVTFRKRIALTFPDEQGGSAQLPGPVSAFLTDTLQAGQALQVDCAEIPAEFLPGGFFPPYVEGVLTVQSPRSLDVRAVYTAAMVDAAGVMEVQSIDVENVPERRN